MKKTIDIRIGTMFAGENIFFSAPKKNNWLHGCTDSLTLLLLWVGTKNQTAKK